MTNTDTVAEQINMFPTDAGLRLRVYSQYDMNARSCTEIASFVIPWHQLGALVDRIESTEKHHIDDVLGTAGHGRAAT
jgi:hypothetical protein